MSRPIPTYLRSTGGSLEQIRALMAKHTIESLAGAAGVTESAVKRWEVIYGARCRRVCILCGGVFAYEAMHLTKSGARRSCPDCHKQVELRASMTDRELLDAEFEIPFVEWVRRALPRPLDGINGWRWAQGGAA